jgi:hypothetical protein
MSPWRLPLRFPRTLDGQISIQSAYSSHGYSGKIEAATKSDRPPTCLAQTPSAILGLSIPQPPREVVLGAYVASPRIAEILTQTGSVAVEIKTADALLRLSLRW